MNRYETLSQALKGKSSGVFKSQATGEYVTISTWYERSTKRIQAIFKKNIGDITVGATRYAINTISEKKIVNMLNENKFELV